MTDAVCEAVGQSFGSNYQREFGQILHFNVDKGLFIAGRSEPRFGGGRMTQVEPIAYSEFQRHLKEGRVKEIAISGNLIQGTYKQALPDGRRRFVTTRVDPELARDLSQSKAKVYMESDTKVTFDDVAGVDEAKENSRKQLGS